MTDHFALLDQPRLPWLDPERLKQAFHEKTLHAHPDTQMSASNSADAEATFALINEAYQTLLDSRRRIQHLLALRGDAPASRFDSVPDDVAALFPAIATLTEEAQRVVAKAANATTALSRSLVTPERLQVRERIGELLRNLSELKTQTDEELKKCGTESESASLHRLYLRYSYLQRWIAQLEEHRLTLQTE